MKTGSILAAIVAVAAIGFGIYMIDIDQTQEASLPDVDVSVEGGSMPEFETTTGDIEMGTEEVTVNVPTIDVQSPEEDASDDS